MEELSNFALWGMDLDLGSMAYAECLIEAMPAYETERSCMLAVRPGWEDGSSDTVPAFEANSFPLLCADQVVVSQGSVIMVMGGSFASHVHDLGYEIGDDWIRVQNRYMIRSATPVESRLIRLRLAERARSECIAMLRSAFDGRVRGERKNPTSMRRLGWATDVAVHAGHYEDSECHHLMLAVGAAIGIEEGDWLARLQVSAEHLRMQPEALASSVNEWVRIIIRER